MNRISLASGIVPECGPLATIDAAEAAGFDAVGLWIEPPGWTPRLLRDTRARLNASGLELLDVEVIWLKPGPPNPDHLRCLDIGMELGAKHVLVVSSDADEAATVARLAALCAHAAPAGLRVALEFGLFTEVKTLAQALRVIAAVQHPAIALLVDPLHLARSGGTPRDVAQVPPMLLPYAQFCDAGATGPGPDDPAGIITEAVDGRLQAGTGGLPLVELLRVLPADIPLSIELRSRALREAHPDPCERALVTARATRRFLETALRG